MWCHVARLSSSALSHSPASLTALIRFISAPTEDQEHFKHRVHNPEDAGHRHESRGGSEANRGSGRGRERSLHPAGRGLQETARALEDRADPDAAGSRLPDRSAKRGRVGWELRPGPPRCPGNRTLPDAVAQRPRREGAGPQDGCPMSGGASGPADQ